MPGGLRKVEMRKSDRGRVELMLVVQPGGFDNGLGSDRNRGDAPVNAD